MILDKIACVCQLLSRLQSSNAPSSLVLVFKHAAGAGRPSTGYDLEFFKKTE